MAQLNTPEKNALRKAARLLDMRDNRGDETYDAQCEAIVAQIREMLLPTEKFVLHVPDDWAFKAKVSWYEIDSEGRKHLYLKIEETAEPPVADGGEQQQEPAASCPATPS